LDATSKVPAANLPTPVAPVADHGALTGLADNDHPQYALAANTPTKTYVDQNEHLIVRLNGNWNYKGQVITARPTTIPPLGEGAKAIWDSSTDASYATYPPLAVVGDVWYPHGTVTPVIYTPPTATSGAAFSTAKQTGGLTVASSNASATQKADADYVCDGTADQVEINAALIKATRPGDGFGGEGHIAVYLVGPDFSISDSILMPPSVSLRGNGRGTLIKPPTAQADKGAIMLLNANCNKFTIESLTIGLPDSVKFGWDGIRLLGNASGATYDLDTGSDGYVFIRDVFVLDTFKKGFWVGGVAGGNGMRGTQITDCVSWNAVGIGVHIDGASDSQLRNIVSCGNAGRAAGFVISGGNTMLTACKAYYRGNASGGNASSGFELLSSRVSAHGCEAQDNGGHGFLISGTDCTVAGCIADSNAAQDSTKAGFYVSNDAVLSGVHAFDRAQSSLKQNNGIIFSGSPQVYVDGVVGVASGSNQVSGTACSGSYGRVVRKGSTVWSVG
jgi:hypothetical protein